MNYLAHAYLSDNHPEIIAGNVSGDFVTNNIIDSCTPLFQKGALFHRFIDKFTDQHPLVKECGLIFKSDFQKYTPVITDVVFDYFLASLWQNYSDTSLLSFSSMVYQSLDDNYFQLPEKFKMILPYMKRQNWLITYQSIDGIVSILERMQKRSKYFPVVDNVKEVIHDNHEFLKLNFIQFFDELQYELKKSSSIS